MDHGIDPLSGSLMCLGCGLIDDTVIFDSPEPVHSASPGIQRTVGGTLQSAYGTAKNPVPADMRHRWTVLREIGNRHNHSDPTSKISQRLDRLTSQADMPVIVCQEALRIATIYFQKVPYSKRRYVTDEMAVAFLYRGYLETNQDCFLADIVRKIWGEGKTVKGKRPLWKVKFIEVGRSVRDIGHVVPKKALLDPVAILIRTTQQKTSVRWSTKEALDILKDWRERTGNLGNPLVLVGTCLWIAGHVSGRVLSQELVAEQLHITPQGIRCATKRYLELLPTNERQRMKLILNPQHHLLLK